MPATVVGPVTVLGIVGFWAIAVSRATSRNALLLGTLFILSAIIAGAALAPGRLAVIVELAATGLAAAVVVWPDRFRLASLDRDDIAADTALRRLALALDGPEPERTAAGFLTVIHAPPFTGVGRWRPVGKLYGVILARLGDPDAGRSPERTPLGAFRRAGRHYWKLALDRRVIGQPRFPGAWDEDVLLRCYLDEFERLGPSDPLPSPISGVGRRRAQMEAIARETAGLSLGHALPAENRTLAVNWMKATLAASADRPAGDSTTDVIAAKRALRQLWHAPAEDHRE